MKRVMIFLVTFLMFLNLCACDSNSMKDNNTNNGDTLTDDYSSSDIVSEPKEIPLTISNVNEYLSLTAYTHDIKVQDNYALGNDKGEGYVRVRASKKKSVNFENVQINISIQSDPDYGWGNFEESLPISWDGEGENDFRVVSYIQNYVSDSPKFNVVITGATGNIVQN